MGLPPTSIDIGQELMDALEQRYRAGELTKNQHLLEKGKLQDRIDRGQAIRRTTFGLVLKWGLVALLLVMAVLTWWLLTPGWAGWVIPAVQLGLTAWVVLTP